MFGSLLKAVSNLYRQQLSI